MKVFDAPSLFLQAPDEWSDLSTYILAAPRADGFTPSVVINVMRQVIMPELQRHIDQQIYELKKLSGFQLLQRLPVATTQKGQTGSIAFLHDNSGKGPQLYQKQVYHMIGQTIWCLTATAPAASHAAIMPPLEAVMATFAPKEWKAA